MRFGKALVCLTGAVIAACSACGMTACREKEIILPEMTAQAPVYESVSATKVFQEYEWYELFLIYNEENQPCLGNVSYDEFMEYYSGEFRQVCNSPFYVLKPNCHNMDQVYYYMYSDMRDDDGNLSDIFIEESYTVFDYLGDEERGRRVEGSTYYYAYSDGMINLNIVAAQLNGIPIGEGFTFEFGELSNPTWYENYLNIYVGKTCVATCYYKIYNDSDGNKKQVPLSWFENYFTENLLLNGIEVNL